MITSVSYTGSLNTKDKSNCLKRNLFSKQEFEKTEADYFANLKRREINYRRHINWTLLTDFRQITQLDQSERKLLQSLNNVGKILDNLVVRAPINGQLSRPQLDVGQSVNTGQRLGQIDIVGSYKVRVEIDELYYPRISQGLACYNNVIIIMIIELEIIVYLPNDSKRKVYSGYEFVGTGHLLEFEEVSRCA